MGICKSCRIIEPIHQNPIVKSVKVETGKADHTNEVPIKVSEVKKVETASNQVKAESNLIEAVPIKLDPNKGSAVPLKVEQSKAEISSRLDSKDMKSLMVDTKKARVESKKYDFDFDESPFKKLDKIKYDEPKDHPYDYDIFIIGGGSGGISTARWASTLGKHVGLADYVMPSPPGSQWEVGGTCVNVGCIPKKMMHYASLLAEIRKDQELAGVPTKVDGKHDWVKLVTNVQKHIKTLNWGYKSVFRELKIKFFNSYASFVDAHTLKLVNGPKEETITADKIVIAVGGRPQYPGIPGDKEFGITSDDLFSLKKSPGKTLVIGASYVALECAGFLSSLGYDTTVMVRSILLRGFDQDMAKKIGEYMESRGTKFIHEAHPTKLEKPDPNGQITVTYEHEGQAKTEQFDTVLFAIGRYAVTKGLNLENIGLKSEPNGKLKVNDTEQTQVPNIYALGDVIFGNLELTPVAIKAGKLLAYRLYGGQTEKMDYVNVPTTVFTPLEYGCVGYTEAAAKEKFGHVNIATYHIRFKAIEWAYNKERPETDFCYVKVLVNKLDNKKVVGFHLLAPNAGEITQGMAVAIRCGATKELIDSCVGVYPSIGDDVVTLRYTKEENPDAKKGSC